MIRRWPLLLCLCGAALIAPLGCALIAKLDGDHVLDITTGTGGGGGGCARTRLPAPPPVALDGDGPDFTVAVRRVDFGAGMNNDQIGLDLDQTCTCPGPPSCAEPAFATASHCDGALGRDNAAGVGFGLIHALEPTIDLSLLSTETDIGAWSILFRVRGYNGQDNDSRVEVALYPAGGGNKPTMAPKWMEQDLWPIASTALGGDKTSVENPLFVDAKAYVTQKTLVARLPAALFALYNSHQGLEHLEIKLSAVIVTAQIEKTTSGAFRLSKGTIAGAWTLPEVFNSLSSLRENGLAECLGQGGIYEGFRDRLCSVVDLAASPTSAGCDALSFGMSFESYPAALGGVIAPPPLTGTPCPKSDAGVSTDPADDSCGPPS